MSSVSPARLASAISPNARAVMPPSTGPARSPRSAALPSANGCTSATAHSKLRPTRKQRRRRTDHRLRDAHPIEEAAVAAAEVFEHEPARAHAHPRVGARDLVVFGKAAVRHTATELEPSLRDRERDRRPAGPPPRSARARARPAPLSHRAPVRRSHPGSSRAPRADDSALSRPRGEPAQPRARCRARVRRRHLPGSPALGLRAFRPRTDSQSGPGMST